MNGQIGTDWMWAQACAMLDAAERRQRHFFELLAATSAVPAWEPPANVFAYGTSLHVCVALPGARTEDVVIHLTPSGLIVEASVAPPQFSKGMDVKRLEIPYGRLRRRIELPPGLYVLREQRLDLGHLHLSLECAP
jgi:HSP20 family molecular chaperone IbpA